MKRPAIPVHERLLEVLGYLVITLAGSLLLAGIFGEIDHLFR